MRNWVKRFVGAFQPGARPTPPLIERDPKLPPLVPWVAYPEWPAFHIAWRMGAGEDHLLQISDWAGAASPEERQHYILSARPIPWEWLMWAAEVYVWDYDPSDPHPESISDAMAMLGGWE